MDNVDAANGAMRVIPGSHKKDALEHNLIKDKNSTLNRELPIENIDEKSAQFIELKAGEVSVHDIGIIQGSAGQFLWSTPRWIGTSIYAVYFMHEPHYAKRLSKLGGYAHGVGKRCKFK